MKSKPVKNVSTSSNSDNYQKYTQTSYSGARLLKKHDLNEVGTWQVSGEDPNCDLGGGHYRPILGVYEGRLEDVIRMAVELPNFWQWGSGGDIEKVAIEKVDENTYLEKVKLLDEKKKLEQRLAQINKVLKN